MSARKQPRTPKSAIRSALLGERFGRLTVIEYVCKCNAGHTHLWKCRCECGREPLVREGNLKSGHTRSCGCYQEDTKGLHTMTHGMTGTRTYHIHSTMMSRCYRPSHDKFKYYGGRGIKVCEEWHKFTGFIGDMGACPEGMELDRIDNDGDYCKENCRWVDRKTQVRNKAVLHRVLFNGELLCLAEVAERTGLPIHALYRRINQWGMTVEEAIRSASSMRRVGRAKA